MTVFDAGEMLENKYTLCYVLSVKLPESTIHSWHPSKIVVVKTGAQRQVGVGESMEVKLIELGF